MVSSSPRILLIDSYDSFTHNLAHLVRRNVPGCQIYLIRNDELTYTCLLPLLTYFSAIVVGPGPGSPTNDSDVGIMKELWSLPESRLLPIFSVCLGFQSMMLAFGGSVRKMRVVKHGMISRIEHVGSDLFDGTAEVEATRYHSLCVDLESKESKLAIEPLAWADDGDENGQVLMAARHRTKPFWGVQYHPESICTHGGGGEIIRNFWKMSSSWSELTGRGVCAFTESAFHLLGDPWPHARLPARAVSSSDANEEVLAVSSLSLELPDLSIVQVCELLGAHSAETNFAILESVAKPGRFTIVGVPLPSTLSIRYFLPETYVTLRTGDGAPRREYFATGSTIWDWLAAFMASRIVSSPGCDDVPFWGGLVGYLSYELGVAELGIPLKHRLLGKGGNADVDLIFVERSIVVDGETGRVHVQSLIPDDNQWLWDIAGRFENKAFGSPELNTQDTTTSVLYSHLTSPSPEIYIAKVKQCQDYLAVGSSYELCLTALSILHLPTVPSHSPWHLYKRLRSSNPAPYAAFLRLRTTSLLCSSPERFLKWDRVGRCELCPIKGTLPKTFLEENGQKRLMVREDADELLGRSVKERAENLMIVDLVRHDLGGVVAAADGVEVKNLMGIEEFETVWQMVSIISGTVSPMSGGWEVLRRSLPPGSMTGAPKKRSIELLQDIEGQERGVYSGVCGYWCVGGSGDWAVIIRSCFRQEDDKEPHPNGDADVPTNGQTHLTNHKDTHLNGVSHEQWTVGAGGAITALSEPYAEWKEMRVKLGSVGRAFGVHEL